MTVTASHAPAGAVSADALDLLAGDPPRYPHVEGDFRRHPETGAPYVNHPTETTKAGAPRRVMYGRPSNFGSALDNPFNLVKWKERQLLIGASILDPDWLGYDINEFDPDDRDALDGLAARCHEAAGSSLAADRGTHIHLLCEQYDKQGFVDGWTGDAGEALGIPRVLQMRIVEQWIQFRRRLGLTALAVEQTVVNDRWRLAGTLDRLDVADHDILTAYGILDAHCPFVGDIKTGSLTLGNDGQPSYWVKYSTQIAAYVDSVPYDTETDVRGEWGDCCPDCDGGMAPPHESIALIYHYDLTRALNGEPVDWQAIPVNVDAGREGGDLCRAAADFAKRRDLFAMPVPTNADQPARESGFEVDQARSDIPETTAGITVGTTPDRTALLADIAASAAPNAVGQPVAEPEPVAPARSAAHGSATNIHPLALRERIRQLVNDHPEAEQLLRGSWPENVPTLKVVRHTVEQLDKILAAVRRVETEVGAGWHPDDGPPPHVNTNPRAEVEYPATPVIDAGGWVNQSEIDALHQAHGALTYEQGKLCAQIAKEAMDAGRSISVAASPTVRRWSIARAVIAWAASGRSVDDLWFTASNLATFDQCRDPAATLGGLISQFTIEQGERLYEAAGQ